MPAPVQPVQPAGGDGTVEGKGNKGAWGGDVMT